MLTNYLNKITQGLSNLWNRGGGHIFIGSFLIKFISFFSSIFIVRLLSKTDYGLLSYIENLYSQLFLFAGFGLADGLLRYMIIAKKPEKKFGYYKFCVQHSTYFNIFILIIVIVFSFIYKHPIKFATAKFLLPILCVALPFHNLYVINTLAYRAMMNNKLYAISTFLGSIFLILFKLIGALIAGLEGVIFSNIFTYLLIGLTYTLLTYSKYFKNLKSQRLERIEKNNLIKYSIKCMITNGIWAFFMLNDVFLLGRFTGDPSIVADYKVAYVIPASISIISISIGIFIGQIFVKNENDKSWVWENYKKTFLINLGLIFLVSLFIFSLARPIVSILYEERYINIVPIMQLLTIAAFLNSGVRYINAHLLASMGKINYNLIISVIGLLGQIILNLLLIPNFGMYGAAYSSIIIYLLMSILLIVIFRKEYH